MILMMLFRENLSLFILIIKKMINFIGLNDIKYVDLPIPIGGYLHLSIDSLYEKMELQFGCTYFFTVYYFNNPLTKNGVPYNPIKLSILDIKNSSDIENSVHLSELTHDYFCHESLLIQFKNKEPITNKVIFNLGISNMVFHSDLIKDIIDNDYKKHIGSIDCLKPQSVGVTRNYVLNLTLVYFKTMV
jgi:hypothetical protein